MAFHRCVTCMTASVRRSMSGSHSSAAAISSWFLINAIERHGRKYPPVLPVERYEVPLFHTAPYDELVPLGVVPGVLEIMLVLIGPEPGNLVVRLVLPQHIPGRRLPLLQRVLPVLDADVALEHGVIVIGYITRRVDPLHTRTAVLVDQDTIAYVHTGTGE